MLQNKNGQSYIQGWKVNLSLTLKMYLHGVFVQKHINQLYIIWKIHVVFCQFRIVAISTQSTEQESCLMFIFYNFLKKMLAYRKFYISFTGDENNNNNNNNIVICKAHKVSSNAESEAERAVISTHKTTAQDYTLIGMFSFELVKLYCPTSQRL